jgi:DNA-binding transcriptional ArsR family regulator
MARLASIPIDSPARWDAVLSGPRLELLLVLDAIGPASVAELAEHLGRPADRLYHHLRKLVGAGLVREVERRAAGRRTEAVYDAVAERLAFDPQAEPAREPIARLARTILRRADRLFERALHAGAVRFGADRNATIRADIARLTGAQLAEVTAHLDRVAEIFEAGRRQPGGRLHTLTIALGPLIRPGDAGADDRPTPTDHARRPS